MLSLRERFDSSAGIFPVLEGMLSRFERNWGIKTSLVTESSDPASYNKFMSSNAEIQLIRIIQEALMNIRRHAEAETVTLKVSEDLDRMIYTIVDDGVGFRLEEIPQESLGLRVIRERASSIEAKVRIDSIEGVGTTLELQIPSHVGEAV
jgi:signal transduction histidine kinase